MIAVLSSAWALLLGMFLLMVGNGVQGTLLGLRGPAEGFDTLSMSIIMSAYFLGFLGGSKLAPEMIRRVGHIRVFAALGSLVSAALILFPVLVHPIYWIIGRIVIGFCFSGIYVTAESWLNNAASNENRGKALSAYMVVQMGGIVLAQYVLLLGDVEGFELFIIPSVLVSLAFAPILLSVAPTPAFETTKPMSLRNLVTASPLASVGMILLGAVFSAQFGMAAVFAFQAGLTVAQTSLFISVIYISALVLQYPIGWISDRMDRRRLIIFIALLGSTGALLPVLFGLTLPVLMVAAALIGGTSNPLYALLIAYANDFLEHEEMAAASAGFVFVNGLGAVGGPIAVGFVMGAVGPAGFWMFISIFMGAIAAYGFVRMLQRPKDAGFSPDDLTPYAPVTAAASPVAVAYAQELYIETELEEAAESGDEVASAG